MKRIIFESVDEEGEFPTVRFEATLHDEATIWEVADYIKYGLRALTYHPESVGRIFSDEVEP